MSFFGSIGNALKGVAKVAAPIALGAFLSPAAGAVAGGLLNGGGKEPPGSSGGFSGPYGLNALTNETQSPAIPNEALGIEDGLLGRAGGFLKDHGKDILGGVTGLNAVLQSKKASDLANRALGSAESSYNERAPLRAQGIQGLVNSQVGNVYAGGR